MPLRLYYVGHLTTGPGDSLSEGFVYSGTQLKVTQEQVISWS